MNITLPRAVVKEALHILWKRYMAEDWPALTRFDDAVSAALAQPPVNQQFTTEAQPQAEPATKYKTCREVPPGNGYCDMCASGKPEKCRYVLPQPQAEPAERKLRRMLCVARSPRAYMDDGEASDCSTSPHIDYLRDTPEEIEAKLIERNRKMLEAQPAKQQEGANDGN